MVQSKLQEKKVKYAVEAQLLQKVRLVTLCT